MITKTSFTCNVKVTLRKNNQYIHIYNRRDGDGITTENRNI